MRTASRCVLTIFAGVGLLTTGGCRRGGTAPEDMPGRAVVPGAAPVAAAPTAPAATPLAGPDGEFVGFDRNDYPGDSVMQSLRQSFSFTGYWLTNPPGELQNTWLGKRAGLRAQGWGFLVLANGRLDAEIVKAGKKGTPAATLGRADAAAAVASAQREGFPAHTTLFLDQEEGGRLLKEQADYLLAWTEAVARTGFRPGVYASGQSVEDSPGQRIDTIQDVRAQVKAGGLHDVAIFDALDQCPPRLPAARCIPSRSALPLTQRSLFGSMRNRHAGRLSPKAAAPPTPRTEIAMPLGSLPCFWT